MLIGVACVSCNRPVPGNEEQPEEAEAVVEQRTGFDPLDHSRDNQIIPSRYPLAANLGTSELGLVDHASRDMTTHGSVSVVPHAVDTANSQVFRIQLFTSQVYGDARQSAEIAEEIFDRSVYVDYEVPYFKVRVGDFNNRDVAEDYLLRARAAGYKEAWVVVTQTAVQQAAPLYQGKPAHNYQEEMQVDDNIGSDD